MRWFSYLWISIVRNFRSNRKIKKTKLLWNIFHLSNILKTFLSIFHEEIRVIWYDFSLCEFTQRKYLFFFFRNKKQRLLLADIIMVILEGSGSNVLIVTGETHQKIVFFYSVNILWSFLKSKEQPLYFVVCLHAFNVLSFRLLSIKCNRQLKQVSWRKIRSRKKQRKIRRRK